MKILASQGDVRYLIEEPPGLDGCAVIDRPPDDSDQSEDVNESLKEKK